MLGERRHKNVKLGEHVHAGAYDICELFSPPRIAETAWARGLRGGWSLDKGHDDPITRQKWNRSSKATQEKVWKLIRRDQPLVIGLSPECTLISALQRLRKTAIPSEHMAVAIECVRFCVEVANYQRKKNRYFYFEHPLTASSWQLEELAGLRDQEDVIDVVLHMCQLNLRAIESEGEGVAKKPTRVLTNLPSLAESISRKCPGGHRHVHLMSGKAKAAAKYTEEFSQAVVDGVEVLLELLTQVDKDGAVCFDMNSDEHDEHDEQSTENFNL